MLPTYLFIICLLGLIAFGVWNVIITGGHPHPVIAPPAMPAAIEGLSVWLLLKAFASGCTAMTGVEAVSNGVRAFRDPVSNTAQFTLTIIIAILAVLLLGIAFLVRAYHVGATDPGSQGYQSTLSLLLAAITGRGWFYWVSISSIIVVLALSANTAFADFPRLCRVIAQNGYLPYSFSLRGRRLVYSQGIYVLTLLAAILLTVFGGVTDRLDSSLCRRSVPGFHALPDRHGLALAQVIGPQGEALHGGERGRGDGDGPDGSGGAGSQVRRRRLDYGTADSYVDRIAGGDQAAFRNDRGGSERNRAPRDGCYL